MNGIVTLSERKRRATEHRSASARRVCAGLSTYARSHGGRFLVFGSAAKGQMRYDSDIDILVDFSANVEGKAVDFVEATCAVEELPLDVFVYRSCSGEFLDRILRHAIDLSKARGGHASPEPEGVGREVHRRGDADSNGPGAGHDGARRDPANRSAAPGGSGYRAVGERMAGGDRSKR